MTTLTMPSVLSFDRKLEPSDAVMHSGSWNNNGEKKVGKKLNYLIEEIELFLVTLLKKS